MQSIRATLLASAAAGLLVVAVFQQASAASTRTHTGAHPLHHHPLYRPGHHEQPRLQHPLYRPGHHEQPRLRHPPLPSASSQATAHAKRSGARARDRPQSSVDLTDAAAKGRPFSFRQ